MKPIDPRLLRHARAMRVHLAVVVALGLAATAMVLVQAELLAQAIVKVAGDGGDRGDIDGMLLWLGVVVVVRALIAQGQEVAAAHASVRVKSDLRSQLVARAAQHAAVAGGTGRAEVANLAVRGLDALDAWFSQYLPQLVLSVIVPVAVLARLATLDLTATMIVVVTLPLIPVFMVLIGRTTEAANARRWRALEVLSHHFLDVAAGMETLRAFGRGPAQVEHVRASTDRYRRTTLHTLRVAFLSSFALELLATLSVALVAVSVGLRLLEGDIGFRAALTVLVLAPEAYLPLRAVGARYHAAAEGVAASARVFEVLEQPAVPWLADDARGAGDASPPAEPAAAEVTAVHVEEVTVVHEGRNLLAPDRLSFTARRGELTALVGPSGSGKSTMLAVLLGRRVPDAGRVVVDVHGAPTDLAVLDPRAWRRGLAWVDQQPYVFAGTVADNVRLAARHASDADVVAALAAAGASSLDPARPVGEGGRELSAGERRRLALARAVVRDAEVVLLDEPTAGLDEAAETGVLDTLRDLARTRVVIIATHRQRSIAASDAVIEVRTGSPAVAP